MAHPSPLARPDGLYVDCGVGDAVELIGVKEGKPVLEIRCRASEYDESVEHFARGFLARHHPKLHLVSIIAHFLFLAA